MTSQYQTNTSFSTNLGGRKYVDRIWGKLHKLHLPSLIIDKTTNQLVLDNYALSILLALLYIHRNDTIRHKLKPSTHPGHDMAIVTADRNNLMRMTGMSKNLIAKGIQSLQRSGYIRKDAQRVDGPLWKRKNERDRDQQFAVSQYTLLHPITKEALRTSRDNDLLTANGQHYFTVPACLFTRHPEDDPESYSFDSMDAFEKRLYIVLCWLATQSGAGEFDATGLHLRKITGMTATALKKALDGLQSRSLVLDTAEDPTIRHIHIVLRNPITGELVTVSSFESNPRDNAVNWYEAYDDGQQRRANLRIPPDVAKSLFLQLLEKRGETATYEGKGEYKFRCPFHDDSTPSCNFNPTKGCFYCFSPACRAKGTTLALLKKLQGDSGEAAIQRVASAMGKTIEYINPDSEAVAIYDYRDKIGNLKKQVLRLTDDVNGNRRFSQRMKGKDGWIYSVKTLKPMLYNQHLFDLARTIFITEGEKDAETITSLNLDGGEAVGVNVAVGTTSGGADSWRPILAKQLRTFSKIIILPDDDEAGEKYSQAIQESLRAEGIAYSVVSFKGTGAKDLTEYMEGHTIENLVRLIGKDKVRMPDGTWLYGSDEFEAEEITV